MELTGIFQITDWQESVEKQCDDGTKLSSAKVKQAYSGDISGVSEVRYQLFYSKQGNATFNGFELITIESEKEKGTLVLKHEGKFESGLASSQFTVIESSLGENWLGRTGSFKSGEGGQANYRIM